MGMLDHLSRVVIGGTASVTREAIVSLRDAYVECSRRAAQLARHAEMAPQGYSIEGLKQLAAEEKAQGERLRQALEAAAAPIPAVAADGPHHGALNHWARLVQDLEMHRAATQQYRELAMRFAESLPKTAGLFEILCREDAAHCEHLRALIARADPQAID